jgi:hypothetical protein
LVILPHCHHNLIPPIVISFSASMNLGVHIITIIFGTSMVTRVVDSWGSGGVSYSQIKLWITHKRAGILFYDVVCGCMSQVEKFLLVLRPVIKEN